MPQPLDNSPLPVTVPPAGVLPTQAGGTPGKGPHRPRKPCPSGNSATLLGLTAPVRVALSYPVVFIFGAGGRAGPGAPGGNPSTLPARARNP